MKVTAAQTIDGEKYQHGRYVEVTGMSWDTDNLAACEYTTEAITVIGWGEYNRILRWQLRDNPLIWGYILATVSISEGEQH